MPKRYTVFAAVALVLLVSLGEAVRTAPVDPKSVHSAEEVQEAGFEDNMEGGCGGVGEDECLMRRTLTAHTDYMYTKDKND